MPNDQIRANSKPPAVTARRARLWTHWKVPSAAFVPPALIAISGTEAVRLRAKATIGTASESSRDMSFVENDVLDENDTPWARRWRPTINVTEGESN